MLSETVRYIEERNCQSKSEDPAVTESEGMAAIKEDDS